MSANLALKYEIKIQCIKSGLKQQTGRNKLKEISFEMDLLWSRLRSGRRWLGSERWQVEHEESAPATKFKINMIHSEKKKRKEKVVSQGRNKIKCEKT